MNEIKNNDIKIDDLANLDNIEIQPLSDEDLDGVAGGFCSIAACSNGTKAEIEKQA